MADQTERLTKLVALLLETARPLTFDEIVEELGDQYQGSTIARRGSFERDKNLLRSEGIPLETEVRSGERAGATGYRILRSRYELADLGLTDDEKHALQLALATVHLDARSATGALWKLGTDDEDAAAPVTASLPDLPQLPALHEARSEGAVVGFTYRDKARQVEPWGLLLRNGFWYLVGLDLGARAQRVFRVDRIEGAVTVGPPGTFSVPEGFDARTAVTTDVKQLGDGAAMSALVLVDAGRAAKVVHEVGDEAVVERRGDGSAVVRVPCTNVAAFRSWVLGLLEHAEVLEPAEVRADVMHWLEAMS